MSEKTEKPVPGLYSGYETCKGLDEFTRYTSDMADYFAGEARGLAIEGLDVLESGFGSGGHPFCVFLARRIRSALCRGMAGRRTAPVFREAFSNN